MFKELFTEAFNEGTLKGKITDKPAAQKLAKMYDFYTSRIDDLKTMKKAEASNKIVLKELKELGVTSISNSEKTVKV